MGSEDSRRKSCTYQIKYTILQSEMTRATFQAQVGWPDIGMKVHMFQWHIVPNEETAGLRMQLASPSKIIERTNVVTED